MLDKVQQDVLDDFAINKLDKVSSMDERQQAMEENSEKFIKKMKLREIYPKKKPAIIR